MTKHQELLLIEGSEFRQLGVLGTEGLTTDSFTLHLSDGKFEKTKTVSVIIELVNDETPRVTVNRGLRAQAGRYRQQTFYTASF